VYLCRKRYARQLVVGYVEFIFNTAKRRADVAFVKKLEILENYPALSTSSQSASAEQLNIMSRGCLRNILCSKIALRSEALLLLLEGGTRKGNVMTKTRK